MRYIVSVLLIAEHAATACATPVLTNLGVLPDYRISRASAISRDGSAVTGHCYSFDGYRRAFRWTRAGGIQDLGVLLGATSSHGGACSGDGATIAGDSGVGFDGPTRAFRWTADGGMQDLGITAESGWSWSRAASSDGSTVVGDYVTTDGYVRAFLWTDAGGAHDLGLWPGGHSASANAISDDGSTVAGSAEAGINHTIAFRWTCDGGVQDLGSLACEWFDVSGAEAISSDGSITVGFSYLDNGDNTACCRATRWTETGGVQDLGALPGQAGSMATAISGDGSVIAGYCVVDYWIPHRPFLWTSTLGMVDLQAYIASQGVDLVGWSLVDVTGLSADGSAMTGWGTTDGQQRAWLITGLSVPEPTTAALLGLAGLLVIRWTCGRRHVGRPLMDDFRPRPLNLPGESMTSAAYAAWSLSTSATAAGSPSSASAPRPPFGAHRLGWKPVPHPPPDHCSLKTKNRRPRATRRPGVTRPRCVRSAD